MKTYVVITSDCGGHICNVYLEKDIWKTAEYAIQECVNHSQFVQCESIEIVEKLNAQESHRNNKVEVNAGPEFFITVCQK